MLSISLNDIGRRFATHWIFRKLHFEIDTGEHTVILGSNGSGKSTLLKIISGVLSPTEGELTWKIDGAVVSPENYFKNLSICTPYLELPEEFNLSELLHFHQKLKPLNREYNSREFAELLEIEYDREKPIHLYSSGMKQRVKLALAILSKNPVVLLDEPLSNLDQHGVMWYRKLVENHLENRLFLVCSNQTQEEYFFCKKQLNILDYKPQG
jgi:ABC-type multidrug transport system ATPase subunit